jgi:hypothetical protein
VRIIPLTKGYSTLVDDDCQVLGQYRWKVIKTSKKLYAARSMYIGNGKYKTLYLHREIMKNPKETVDHANGDSLDNRKENLRTATMRQQSQNRVSLNGVSKGVSKHGKKYRAYICPEGKTILLGLFTTLEEAKEAYNNAALETYGEFAKLNV